MKPSPWSHRSLAPPGERWWRRGVAGIPLVDLSEPLSGSIGDDPRLIGATARENRSGDAGKLVASAIASMLRLSRRDPWGRPELF